MNHIFLWTDNRSIQSKSLRRRLSLVQTMVMLYHGRSMLIHQRILWTKHARQPSLGPVGDGEWSDIPATEGRIADVREIDTEAEGRSLDVPVVSLTSQQPPWATSALFPSALIFWLFTIEKQWIAFMVGVGYINHNFVVNLLDVPTWYFNHN